MNVLETKNLIKHFDGVYAVNKISISIEKGKITGIIGPNGSGKTTLLNVLSGVLPIDGGLVVVGESLKLASINPYEISFYGITRTFQEIRLFEQLSVLDNILIVLTERKMLNSIFEKHGEYHLKKAQEVLERVNLWDKKNHLAQSLSYGQRKLLEIARALAMNSEIYFLDEPFAGLFPEMIKIITAALKELRQRGKTIILVEHNMNLIRELCDYILVMDEGKLLAEGKPEQVLREKK